MDRIVVGVDGSEGSVAALEWAVAEARVRGVRVEAIQAFHVPYSGGTAMMPLMLDPNDFREAAVASLAKTVAGIDTSGLVQPVGEFVVEGSASTVLIEAGRRSSMVVVGARGHGGLAGMLMGSISRQVSEHATVPVVVVPLGRQ